MQLFDFPFPTPHDAVSLIMIPLYFQTWMNVWRTGMIVIAMHNAPTTWVRSLVIVILDTKVMESRVKVCICLHDIQNKNEFKDKFAL